MVFLGTPNDPAFSAGPGSTAPDGFTRETYYRAIIAGTFGKLQERGGQWSTSGATRAYRSIKSKRP